ncbi:MAG: sugar isomerase domain-containing protein [Alkaliphilus sp.]
MMKYGLKYISHVCAIIEKIKNIQLANLNLAAIKFASTIESGNTIFAFGVSHSGIIAEEMFYRTGGLAIINPIFNPTLMLNTRPVTLTSKMERIEKFGEEIIKSSAIKQGDLILIHSVSGRNPVIVDAALQAKKMGAYVIGLTNLEYSQNVSSRHKNTKRLFEVVDLSIDNCGDFEDSSIEIPNIAQKTGPTSTVTGAMIVNSIIVETCHILVQKGITPPIFHSSNVDGGDEFNKKLLEKYKSRIHYL